MDGRVREPASGEHKAEGPPKEIIAGWIVRCTCGWTNEMRPGRTQEEARQQLAAHTRQGR